MSHCHACGRPLRDPRSRESGVGPTCARRGPTNEETLFRAAYFTEVIDGVLVIFDRDCGSTSVTVEFGERGRLPPIVIYRDRDGCYSRLKHRNGVFGGFAKIGAVTLSAALAGVHRPPNWGTAL
jgi:Family of unknown function (DUF6011)